VLAVSGRPYRAHPELSVICAYFNPMGYVQRLANFRRFLAPFVQGEIDVITAEGHLPGAGGLPADLPVTVVAAEYCDIMWQKERLLNLALARVPSTCRYVAWVDCDILFDDPDWMIRAVAVLERERAGFVQPFDTVFDLPPDSRPSGRPIAQRGYARSVARDPSCLETHSWSGHGHTGYAWVARIEFLKDSGFYDRCIIGSGDHVMAHAMTDTARSGCVTAILGSGGPYYEDFVSWASGWARSRWAGTAYLPGSALHLWHGDPAGRRYLDRNLELRRLGFDPSADLELTPEGCWRFAADRRDLAAWATGYFRGRREDG
jgi:hypothetical protein